MAEEPSTVESKSRTDLSLRYLSEMNTIRETSESPKHVQISESHSGGNNIKPTQRINIVSNIDDGDTKEDTSTTSYQGSFSTTVPTGTKYYA